jgi:hypothetical protein
MKLMIAKPRLVENTTALMITFLHIAKHGVYIPVCDVDGNIIYSPEDFKLIKNKFLNGTKYSDEQVAINYNNLKFYQKDETNI